MGHLHDDVIRTVSDQDVRFIRLWFSDIVGTLKSIAISPADLEIAFTEGIGIDGSTIEGLTRSYESDMILRPDPATFELLAWRGETNATGRMMCDVLTPDGEPAASDPRRVLKDALVRVEGEGVFAQMLQHETDHLDGIVYVETLPGERRREARSAIRRSDWF